MITKNEILKIIPHRPPFRFVDEFITISCDKVKGKYTFKPEAYFYKGHFPENPITPGVILTETMVQIGLLGLGIFNAFKIGDQTTFENVVLSASDVSFLKPVYPKESVTVEAEKIYFRFGKLKCRAKMFDKKGEVVCKGDLSGMLLFKRKE